MSDDRMMRAIAENARALALRSRQRGSRVLLNPLDVIALANVVLVPSVLPAGATPGELEAEQVAALARYFHEENVCSPPDVEEVLRYRAVCDGRCGEMPVGSRAVLAERARFMQGVSPDGAA